MSLESARKYNKENKQKVKLQHREHKRKIKLMFMEYKGGACQVCGLVDDPVVYDFHHVNPELKEFKLSNKPYNEKSLKELDKCIMVCSNCHRKIHKVNE